MLGFLGARRAIEEMRRSWLFQIVSVVYGTLKITWLFFSSSFYIPGLPVWARGEQKKDPSVCAVNTGTDDILRKEKKRRRLFLKYALQNKVIQCPLFL